MILLPSSFCPSVAYLALLAKADEGEVCINTSEIYQKQTFRNRTILLTSGGPLHFTIPVEKFGYPSPPISEIMISDHGDWRHRLSNTLSSNYGITPFWSHYESEIMALINDECHNLCSYNYIWLKWILNKWGLNCPEMYKTDASLHRSSRSVDINLEDISSPNILSERYWQVFESKIGFQPNVSALDLLLCEGPYGVSYLMRNGADLKRLFQ